MAWKGVVAMNTYTAVASRDGRHWHVRIPGLNRPEYGLPHRPAPLPTLSPWPATSSRYGCGCPHSPFGLTSEWDGDPVLRLEVFSRRKIKRPTTQESISFVLMPVSRCEPELIRLAAAARCASRTMQPEMTSPVFNTDIERVLSPSRWWRTGRSSRAPRLCPAPATTRPAGAPPRPDGAWNRLRPCRVHLHLFRERDTEESGDDAFRVYGHSKDHRNDLPQIVIGLAVTKEGIPVRVWCWPDASLGCRLAPRAGSRHRCCCRAPRQRVGTRAPTAPTAVCAAQTQNPATSCAHQLRNPG